MEKNTAGSPTPENDQKLAEKCLCGSALNDGENVPVPMVSRVFDIFGVIFVALAIIFFIGGFFSESVSFYLTLSFFMLVSGLLYTGGAELLRAAAETACNTRQLLFLKQQELQRK